MALHSEPKLNKKKKCLTFCHESFIFFHLISWIAPLLSFTLGQLNVSFSADLIFCCILGELYLTVDNVKKATMSYLSSVFSTFCRDLAIKKSHFGTTGYITLFNYCKYSKFTLIYSAKVTAEGAARSRVKKQVQIWCKKISKNLEVLLYWFLSPTWTTQEHRNGLGAAGHVGYLPAHPYVQKTCCNQIFYR